MTQPPRLFWVGFVWLIVSGTGDAGWPQFRGTGGQGHGDATDLPAAWTEKHNIGFKVAVPGKGWSSPVVGGEHIWMTTATEGGRSLRALCFDRDDGRLLHNVELFRHDQPGPLHAKNSFATPTPVIDGNRVYFHFGPRGTACVSDTGRIVWKNTSLEYSQPYSGASSPILFRDRLILTCDGGDVQFVVALEKRSGKVLWLTRRAHNQAARVRARTGKRKGYATMSYATPLVINSGGVHQLVSPAADLVAGYDVATGRELWWFGYDGFSLVARPVSGHGLVYVVGVIDQGRPELYAIRTRSRGKLTRDDLAWQLAEGCPQVPSPLLIGNELYLVKDNGVASRVDALTGKVGWKHRLGGNYSASPLFADGKIFFFSEEGKTTVIRPAASFRAIAINQLDGRILASPAATGRALFIRTDTCLYRIQAR